MAAYIVERLEPLLANRLEEDDGELWRLLNSVVGLADLFLDKLRGARYIREDCKREARLFGELDVIWSRVAHATTGSDSVGRQLAEEGRYERRRYKRTV